VKTLTLDIPDSVDFNEVDAKMLLAGILYELEKLTLEQAAKLTGLTKKAFTEMVGKYGFSIVSDSLNDLHADIENV